MAVLALSAYIFSSGGLKNFVLIPAVVVDRHLKECSAEALKALLYLLRHEDQSITEEELCAAAGLADCKLEEVLGYWVKTGVLRKKGATLTLAATGTASDAMPVFSAETIMLRSTQDKDLAALFTQAEKIKSTTLSPAEINAIYNLYDTVGLPAPVIALLLEYCTEAGKPGARYLQACGCGWYDEGITTAALAAEKIEAIKAVRAAQGQIMKALGITGRNLTTKEREYIALWTESYGYGIEEILYAYEKTADNTGKLSFAYMNKILTAAYESGCKTTQDMEKLNAPAERTRAKKSGRPLKNNSESSIRQEDLFRPFWEVIEK